jgi:hypothetical protein
MVLPSVVDYRVLLHDITLTCGPVAWLPTLLSVLFAPGECD